MDCGRADGVACDCRLAGVVTPGEKEQNSLFWTGLETRLSGKL